MDENRATSCKEMCEAISEHWRAAHCITKTPEQIFNYSPTGELFMLWAWYEEAQNHRVMDEIVMEMRELIEGE